MEPKCKKKTDVVKCVLPWSNLARLNYALGNRKSEASPCLGTSRVIPASAASAKLFTIYKQTGYQSALLFYCLIMHHKDSLNTQLIVNTIHPFFPKK